MYYVNFRTGTRNSAAEKLEEAFQIADEKAAVCTRQPLTIHDERGVEVARRNWVGIQYDPRKDHDTKKPICFGVRGYYCDWQTIMET